MSCTFFVSMNKSKYFHKSIDFYYLELYHYISRNQKLNVVHFLIRNKALIIRHALSFELYLNLKRK